MTDERLRWYGNLTKHLPAHLFRDAIRRASLEAGAFPPGPGDILRAGAALDPGKANPGQLPGPPKWYRVAMGQMRSREQPREIGPRSSKPDQLSEVFD